MSHCFVFWIEQEFTITKDSEVITDFARLVFVDLTSFLVDVAHNGITTPLISTIPGIELENFNHKPIFASSNFAFFPTFFFSFIHAVETSNSPGVLHTPFVYLLLRRIFSRIFSSLFGWWLELRHFGTQW